MRDTASLLLAFFYWFQFSLTHYSYNIRTKEIFSRLSLEIRSTLFFPMKSTTHKPQNKENWGSFSCMQKKMKRKKRFETMKKLLEIEETPWGLQQGGISADERMYEEEHRVPSPHRKFSKQKQFHPSLMVVAKKPRQSRSCKRRMATMHNLCDQVEVASSVMQRAEAVQAKLNPMFPSFVKPMIRSNVTKGFWLSLPGLFCKLYLPDHDITIVLEDEDCKQYITKYLAQRRGLSAGWMGFSIAHKLVEGDVLVFHMVKFNKLKVYIIRSSCLAEVDAALCLLQLESPAKEKHSGHGSDGCRGLQTNGENNTTSSELICQKIYGKSMPDNKGLVMGQPKNIDWDLQVDLKGFSI